MVPVLAVAWAAAVAGLRCAQDLLSGWSDWIAGENEAEAVVVAALIVALAAAVAGGVAGEGADAVGDEEAGRALVAVLAGDLASGKWEVVAGRFAGDAEIGAGLAPFRAMDFDAAAAGAPVGEEVSGFVAEGAEDLGMADGVEAWIQFNHRGAGAGGACGGLKPGIPDDGEALGDWGGSRVGEPCGGDGGEAGVRACERWVGGWGESIGGAAGKPGRSAAREGGEFSASSHG